MGGRVVAKTGHVSAVPGSWSLVPGPRSQTSDPWFLVADAGFLVPNNWSLDRGSYSKPKVMQAEMTWLTGSENFALPVFNIREEVAARAIMVFNL